MPTVGERRTLVDHDGARHGEVETTRVEVVRLDQVGGDVAADEGEGFTDAAAWRRSHVAFWAALIDEIRAECGDESWELSETEPVVVEWFRLIPEGG